MLSPLKLSVIVCGAAAGLAVAPYIVKQVLPPESAASTEAAAPVVVADAGPSKVDLPIAAPAAQPAALTPAIMPVSTVAPAAKKSPAPQAELRLSAPTLPSPAPALPSAPVQTAKTDLTLPSLAAPEVASAMPAPSITPAPTPSPTPEIPYRSEVEAAQKLMKELGLNTGKIDGKLGPNTQAAVRKFQKEHALTENGEVNSDLISAMENAVAALPTPTPVPDSKIEITDASSSKNDKSDEPAISGADDPNALLVRKEAAGTADSKVSKKTVKPKVDPGPVPTLQNMKDVRKIQEQLKLAGTYEGDVDGKWGDLTRAAMREFQEKAGLEVTGKPNKATWLAMHSGAVTADSDGSRKKETASKDDDNDAGLEISSVDSEATTKDNKSLVVSVNGDGVEDPDKVKPLATPRAVSSLSRNSDSKSGDSESDKEEPKVKVSTPRETDEANDKSSSAADDMPSDLAVASDNREEQKEKLRAEIERRRAKIQSVSSDSTYEVKKYAPKMLETVNSMVDDIKIETVSNNPAAARQQLEKIDEELERAKTESMKKKATEMVDEVRTSYEALKKNFPTRIKCLSLKNEEEKSQREELTELVAKVDLGFEAMEKDYKKGNYDPIFKNGKGFSSTINEINRTMAEVYVTAKLDEGDVKDKLDEDLLDDLKAMQKSKNYVKAADKLQAALD